MTTPLENIPEYVDFAARLADAARFETLPRFRGRSEIIDKAGPQFDPVTAADREAERVQRRLIAQTYPDHGVIGEEFGAAQEDADWRWVLDPVDGTRAFVCGAPTWTTLIALEHKQKPVIGLIDQPFTDERWIAVGGRTRYSRAGATVLGKTSGLADLSVARISTTDPRPDVAYFDTQEAAAFERIAKASRVARFSFDAYAYGLLAIGELDLVIETGLAHHDYAALAPVVEAAQGVITDWRGGPAGADGRGGVVAAASAELHAAALALLSD